MCLAGFFHGCEIFIEQNDDIFCCSIEIHGRDRVHEFSASVLCTSALIEFFTMTAFSLSEGEFNIHFCFAKHCLYVYYCSRNNTIVRINGSYGSMINVRSRSSRDDQQGAHQAQRSKKEKFIADE